MDLAYWYIILVALPGAVSLIVYPLQRRPDWAIGFSLAACLGELFVWSRLSPGIPKAVFGQTVSLTALSYFFIPLLICVVAACIYIGWLLFHGLNFSSVALAVLSLSQAVFILDATNVIIAAVLLTLASLVLVFGLVDQPFRAVDLLPVRPIGGAINYTVLMFIALICFVVAGLFLHHYELNPIDTFTQLNSTDTLTVRIVVATLAVGLIVRLGIIPLHIWLPEIAEQAEVMATVLALGVLDTVAFIFLLNLVSQFPYQALLAQAVTARRIIEVLGAIAVVGGAFTALAQKDLRRFIAYSIISDTGLILFGFATLTLEGVSGAILEILHLVIIKLLLFTCAGIIQYCTGSSVLSPARGLGRKLPATSIGFIVGGLSLIGLPPFGGAMAKLLLYTAAAQYSPWWLFVFVSGAFLLIVGYTRVGQYLFFGPASEEAVLAEPRPLVVMVLILTMLLIISGLYPQFTGSTVIAIVRSFNFIR